MKKMESVITTFLNNGSALKDGFFHIHEEEEAAHTAVGPVLFGGFHLIPLKREETNGTGSKKDCSLSPHSC